MADYTPTTDFSTKDALPSGDPSKIIKGSDFDVEFAAIETAIATKVEASDISALSTVYQPLDAELTAVAGLTSAANKVPMFSGSGTATLIDFKDEDDMASDSATAVPSQQSVKAYADIAASTTVAGKVELATAAETQAVTATDRAVTPVSLASLLPVAWVSFDGTTNTAGNCTIGADYNVSTVTDNGIGDYTINFSNALADAHYAIAGWSYGDGVIISGNGSSAPTSSGCRIRNRGHEGSYVDSAKITVIFFR